MATITTKNNLKISKTTFIDVYDLYNYILENYIELDFHELKDDEISEELRKKVEESKKKSLSSFVNTKTRKLP